MCDKPLFGKLGKTEYIAMLKPPRMNRPQAILALLAALIGYFSSPTNAQVNLKSGYNISFLSTPGLNQVISDINASRPYQDPFPSLSWLHGFELGIRFKSESNAFELSYQGAYQNTKAKGDFNGGSEPFTDKLRFQTHSMGAGYQLCGDRAGIGAEFLYQWYITKAEWSPGPAKFKDVQNMTATRVYFMVIFPGIHGVDFVVEPYYLLPFDDYDPSPLAQFAELSGPYGQDNWSRFGISLLFYNGEK